MGFTKSGNEQEKSIAGFESQFEFDEAGEVVECQIDTEQAGKRADIALADVVGVTRSNMQNILEAGRVRKGDKVLKSNYKVKVGDKILVQMPEPEPLELVPENIPVDIIYEDDDVVVLNKARGMVVHPAPGNYTGTLVNALLYHCKNLSGINGVIRPGIVHRLAIGGASCRERG